MQDTFIDDTYVNTLSLGNQSGTVMSLECYYKESTGDDAKRLGNSGAYPVGQGRSLDLKALASQHGLKEDCWITAYANVKAGRDSTGTVWVRYRSNYDKTANYTISGVINFTKVAFNGVTNNNE